MYNISVLQMKGNKDQFLMVRVTTGQRNALKRISKRRGVSIPQLIRSFIDQEELKLMESEYNQEVLFERTKEEEEQYLARVVNLVSTIPLYSGKVLVPSKKGVVRLGRKKQRGDRLNE